MHMRAKLIRALVLLGVLLAAVVGMGQVATAAVDVGHCPPGQWTGLR